MDTVVNQHGLDVEALKSSCLPHAGGTQTEDSGSAHLAGISFLSSVSVERFVYYVENLVWFFFCVLKFLHHCGIQGLPKWLELAMRAKQI